LQADSGLLLRWRVREWNDPKAAEKFVAQAESLESLSNSSKLFSIDAESNAPLAPLANPLEGAERMIWTDLEFSESARLQFSGNCNLSWRIWIDNRLVHQRTQLARPVPESQRFDVAVGAGITRVLVLIPANTEEAMFQLHFRRASSTTEHERLARFVLENKGDVERGREVFLNAEKSLCTKCHRLNGQGGAIGPDLTGIGRRFSRTHLIESILEPSRTIAPSYETVAVAMADGRVLAGIPTGETNETLTLGDDQGKLHELPKAHIDERVVQARSTMPDGLEKRLSDRELLNLVTFLVSEGAMR
jgi:putative heme-binding domain-containing protein